MISKKTDTSTTGTFVEPEDANQSLVVQSDNLPSKGSSRYVDGMLLPDVDRMIVLVSQHKIADVDFARKIWAMASPAHMDVLYVCIVRSADEQMQAERRLVTLAAVTRDAWIHVEKKVFHGSNWSEAIRMLWKPGDVVVCHAELTVRKGWFGRESLDRALMAAHLTPVYVLFEIADNSKPMPVWKHRALLIPYWLSFVAIILGFFQFQARIYQADGGLLGAMLVFLSFIIELSLILFWNSIQV